MYLKNYPQIVINQIKEFLKVAKTKFTKRYARCN